MAAALRQRATQFLQVLTKGRTFDRVAEKLEIVTLEEGKCTCKLLVAEEHENRLGTLHGGMTASLIDIVTTLAVMSTGPKIPGVSLDLSVSYLRPARRGEEIFLDAQVVKIGKSVAFTTAELKNTEGRLIALGRHTKHVGQSSTPGNSPFSPADKGLDCSKL